MPRNVVVSVGNSWDGPEPGLVGFLWGTPEALAGSRRRLFRDSGLRLPGKVNGSRGWQSAAGPDWAATPG